VVNPSGDLARYRALSLEVLGTGIRRVVGCYFVASPITSRISGTNLIIDVDQGRVD